jgi:oxalate decarboxylase/phosphoglucose isomerase-like protein (cupin superfamily)
MILCERYYEICLEVQVYMPTSQHLRMGKEFLLLILIIKRRMFIMEKVKGKRFVSVDDVETQVFPWGSISWLSEPRVTGTDNMTLGVVTMEKGKGHGMHNHAGCEEIIYVVEGEGLQTIEVEGKVIEQKIKKGDLVHIPPGIFHSNINTEDTPMVSLAIYQFPGSEASLRNDPECKIIPAKNRSV